MEEETRKEVRCVGCDAFLDEFLVGVRNHVRDHLNYLFVLALSIICIIWRWGGIRNRIWRGLRDWLRRGKIYNLKGWLLRKRRGL